MLVGLGDRGLAPEFMCGFTLAVAGCIIYAAIVIELGDYHFTPYLIHFLVLIAIMVTLYTIKIAFRTNWGNTVIMSTVMVIGYTSAGVAGFSCLDS